MYKFLLCWRYLRTRYIALASVISVTLGVGTMIVVNSVMAGFSHDMQGRIKGIICDVVLESRSLEGMRDADWHMDQIKRIAGADVEGMTPVCVVPAMLSYRWCGNWVTSQVNIIGIDEKSQSKVSDFGKYLQHPENRREMSFALRPGGYDVHDHLADGPTEPREQMQEAGWKHRTIVAQELKYEEELLRKSNANAPLPVGATQGANPPLSQGEGRGQGNTAAAPSTTPPPFDPFSHRPQNQQQQVFDMSTQQCTGLVLGIAMSNFRKKDGKEFFRVLPGDDVQLTFPTTGAPPKAVSDKFTVVDFYESKMLEYDSLFAFMPIKELQRQRGMRDPATGVGYVNAIEIKIRPGADGDAVRDKLKEAFDERFYKVETWRDKQGPLLDAVQMETTVLNILLFLIVAVAGFGILAIFFMIVVEKTRDIGILKSLGASAQGVMGIFLTYGLSLGIVGSGVGMIGGLTFVHYINKIADFIGYLTGRPVFNPEIYYLYKIPTIIYATTVAWIVAGAIGIAVLASVWPAFRAARLHPVEALRYE